MTLGCKSPDKPTKGRKSLGNKGDVLLDLIDVLKS